jgi:hypothetical protein
MELPLLYLWHSLDVIPSRQIGFVQCPVYSCFPHMSEVPLVFPLTTGSVILREEHEVIREFSIYLRLKKTVFI